MPWQTGWDAPGILDHPIGRRSVGSATSLMNRLATAEAVVYNPPTNMLQLALEEHKRSGQ